MTTNLGTSVTTLLTGIVDALIGEGQCAQKHNPKPTDRFHVYVTSSAFKEALQIESRSLVIAS
jgi:hypothetical protein